VSSSNPGVEKPLVYSFLRETSMRALAVSGEIPGRCLALGICRILG